MPARRSILVISDLRAAVPTTVQPFAGIDRYVRDRGLPWNLVVEPRPPLAPDPALPFHGVIGRIGPDSAAFAAKARIPIVNIWASSPVQKVPCVIADFVAAGRLAAEFLVARGLRQLVYVGTRLRFSKSLEEGFREEAGALKARVRTIRENWWFDRTATSFARFMDHVNKLIATLEPPVGIFGFDDFACRHIARACQQRGLRVPGDVAILGLTNNQMACLHPPPSLSSIDLDLELVGRRAAELLDAMLRGRAAPKEPILVPPQGIVPRDSTDDFAAADEAVVEAMRFIAARHAGRLRVGEIARHVATSERTLQRRFVETVGHSIVHEILLQRLRRAKQLLIDTNQLVKQVAVDCGFADSQRFCRTFRRHEGVSPATYRDRYRS